MKKGTCISKTGKRYGRLVVKDTWRGSTETRALCQCDCGTRFETRASILGKHTNSCGCIRAETAPVNGAKSRFKQKAA